MSTFLLTTDGSCYFFTILGKSLYCFVPNFPISNYYTLSNLSSVLVSSLACIYAEGVSCAY